MSVDPKANARFTLTDEISGKEVILTEESLRIIICAVAGFELTREERAFIRPEYMELLELHRPGTVRR